MGRIDIADTDNDQFIDFVITGTDSIGNCYSIVYDNNNGTIRKTENEIVGFEDGTIVFGDWDVNGRPDPVSSSSTEIRRRLSLP